MKFFSITPFTISSLATTSALNTVENKISSVNNLVKKKKNKIACLTFYAFYCFYACYYFCAFYSLHAFYSSYAFYAYEIFS